MAHATSVAPDPTTLARAIEVLNSDYRITKSRLAFNPAIEGGLTLVTLGSLVVALDVTNQLVGLPNKNFLPWGALPNVSIRRLGQIGISVIAVGSLTMTGGFVYEGFKRLRHRPTDDERIREELSHFFSLSPRRQLKLAEGDPDLANTLIQLADIMTSERRPNLIVPLGAASRVAP